MKEFKQTKSLQDLEEGRDRFFNKKRRGDERQDTSSHDVLERRILDIGNELARAVTDERKRELESEKALLIKQLEDLNENERVQGHGD